MSSPIQEIVSQDIATRENAVESYILHHVTDSQTWSLPFLPNIQLPAPLSLHGVMVILCAVFLLILFGAGYRRKTVVPTCLTNLLEVLILFIRNEISIACLGEEDGRTWPRCSAVSFSLFSA